MKVRFLAAAAVATVTLAACGDDAPATTPSSPAVTTSTSTGSSPAVSAPAVSGTVGADAFLAVTALPEVVLLDFRTPAEFAEGHLAKAVNIDVEAPDFEAKVIQLDRSKRYAVYCRSGRRSAIAMDKMAALGFASIVDLGGGITAWEAAGHPVER